MARVRKPQPSLETLFFSSPEQRVFRLLLSEPTTSFSIRVISSKLKGVRGLGGADGITRILNDLSSLGLVDFVDNQRAVRIHDESICVKVLKTFGAICDLESLRRQIEPISSRGVLFGSRAAGRNRSDSDYDLFIVTEAPGEVREIADRHPLGKRLELVVWTPEQYNDIEKDDPGLARKLETGVSLWGSAW
jgi:hypothetical protein